MRQKLTGVVFCVVTKQTTAQKIADLMNQDEPDPSVPQPSYITAVGQGPQDGLVMVIKKKLIEAA